MFYFRAIKYHDEKIYIVNDVSILHSRGRFFKLFSLVTTWLFVLFWLSHNKTVNLLDTFYFMC